MALQLGVHTGQQDIEMDELRKLWRYVDSRGFDFVSIWDHFYEAPPIDGTSPEFESVACMAAIAVETQHVRIGCHVFCMGYRNPVLLANSLMTIDHLSHRRVEAAVGAGPLRMRAEGARAAASLAGTSGSGCPVAAISCRPCASSASMSNSGSGSVSRKASTSRRPCSRISSIVGMSPTPFQHPATDQLAQ